MAVERKIQIVIRETKKIVERLSETFEKKIVTTLARKYEESGVAKIKEQYNSAVKTIEHNYKKEIERLVSNQKDVEKKMMGRVGAIE